MWPECRKSQILYKFSQNFVLNLLPKAHSSAYQASAATQQNFAKTGLATVSWYDIPLNFIQSSKSHLHNIIARLRTIVNIFIIHYNLFIELDGD